jgi:hypothetical protein
MGHGLLGKLDRQIAKRYVAGAEALRDDPTPAGVAVLVNPDLSLTPAQRG